MWPNGFTPLKVLHSTLVGLTISFVLSYLASTMIKLKFNEFLVSLGLVLIASCFTNISCIEETSKGNLAAKKLPKLGVGVLDIASDSERENVLVWALNAGYRMIDIFEGDEIPVKYAISRSKVPREDITLVVKLIFPNETENLSTEDNIMDILDRCGTTYIDLLLINFPYFNNTHFDVWKAMIALKDAGKIRHIGVSNFRYEEIVALEKATGIFPSVAQLEINPFNQQSKLVKNLTALGIAIQAYSVLTNGQKLNDQRLIKIARSYDATAAQTLIQWCLQKGYSCVTKSTKQQHLEDNINLGEFHLEDEDMKELDSLEEGFVTNFNAEIALKDADQYDSYADEQKAYSEADIKRKTPTSKKGRRGDDFDEHIDYANGVYDDEEQAPRRSDAKGKLGNGQLDSDSQNPESNEHSHGRDDSDSKYVKSSAKGRNALKGDYGEVKDEF